MPSQRTSSLLGGHGERAHVFPAYPHGEDKDGSEAPGAVQDATAQRSRGDAQPAHVPRHAETGARGARGGRPAPWESKQKGKEPLTSGPQSTWSRRPQPARSLLRAEPPAGLSSQHAPAWEEAWTGRRAQRLLAGE